MHGRHVPTAADVAADPGWFPENYDPRQGTLSFVRADRATLAGQAFLDSRWNREELERCELSLDALAAVMPPRAPANMHFIWHTSFCCSTLIAEALDLPGRNLSLREPFVLVPLADAKRAATPANRPPLPPRLSELVFGLLGRSAAAGESVVVKPSNFANVLMREAARRTVGRTLFLYSDLESFLISVEKGGLPLRKYARRLFGNIAGDSGVPLRWPARDIFQMSDLEIAALAWHMQIDQFQRAARLFEPGRLASLDCEAFLGDPVAALNAIDAFFALGLGADHIGRVAAGPLMARHAKDVAQPFDAQQRRDQGDSVRRRLGANLERVVEWSYRAFPGTPRGTPLAGALFESAKP